MSSYAIIEEHLARGRLDPADAMVGLLLEQNADDARAHILLARLLAIRGRTDEGIVRLEQLLGKNPRVPDALAWLAVLWRNKGDKERALLLARRAVALGAKVAECEIMLGDDALARGDVVEASSFFDRATSRGGGRLARAWLGKGKVQRLSLIHI